MSDDQPEVRPRDALEIAQRALAKANEQEDLIGDLQERVIGLEAKAADHSDYATLDRETKVGLVREHVVQKARAQHGMAAIDYDDVMWEVFSGEPSADHCYTLMQLAAQSDGFDVRDPSDGNKELVVNIDATKPELGFSHANKDTTEGEQP